MNIREGYINEDLYTANKMKDFEWNKIVFFLNLENLLHC